EQNESSNDTKNQQTGHKRDEPLRIRDIVRAACEVGDEQMAHHTHGRCGHHFVELEANECLEPSPEYEVGLVENDPRNEDWSNEPNYGCSNCPVSNNHAN